MTFVEIQTRFKPLLLIMLLLQCSLSDGENIFKSHNKQKTGKDQRYGIGEILNMLVPIPTR
jgi:hypothetical protein